MTRNSLVASLLAVGIVVSGACNRGESPVPPAETQSQAAKPANQPLKISGCLKAGEGSDTFVLTAARTQGSSDTATYVLVGNQGVNLRDHVGHQVEVNGVVRAEQEVASRSSAQPADRATGTSGTPTVQTQTEVELKRLEVSGIQPVGDRCES